MILFKVVKTDYADAWHDYSKTTSFRVGARWNLANVPAMYFSTNVQNAMLEIANYMPSPKMVNRLFVVSIFEFPSLRVHSVEPKELPWDWAADAHQPESQQLGSSYLLDAASYDAILVPSAAINRDIATNPINGIRVSSYSNIVVNPETVGLEKIRLLEHREPVYSHRMFG